MAAARTNKSDNSKDVDPNTSAEDSKTESEDNKAQDTNASDNKETPVGPSYSREDEPEGSQSYVLPGGFDWTPPCAGAVGSMPNLDDISRQNQENTSAFREGRKAQPLAIHCGFCQGYHKEMQPPTNVLVGGEVTNSYYQDVPDNTNDPKAPSDLVEVAIAAVTNPDNIEENDSDSGSDESDSDTEDSSSNTR
jgi:hypothetical protein